MGDNSYTPLRRFPAGVACLEPAADAGFVGCVFGPELSFEVGFFAEYDAFLNHCYEYRDGDEEPEVIEEERAGPEHEHHREIHRVTRDGVDAACDKRRRGLAYIYVRAGLAHLSHCEGGDEKRQNGENRAGYVARVSAYEVEGVELVCEEPHGDEPEENEGRERDDIRVIFFRRAGPGGVVIHFPHSQPTFPFRTSRPTILYTYAFRRASS